MTTMPDAVSSAGKAPQEPPVKDTVRKKKPAFAASTQRYLPVAEIKEDTLVLKNGGIRAILRVSALNFNLKSEVEQQGIIAGYQSFVNTLIFPIQIIMRSTRLNIDPYIKGLRERATRQTNLLLRDQAQDYAEFMEKLVDVAGIMQKNFYLIVPLDTANKTKRGLIQRFMEWLTAEDTKAKALQRSRDFKAHAKVLRDRVTLVQSGLENIGVTIHRLQTHELTQLLYDIYNPLTAQKQKFNTLEELNLDTSTVI